MACHQFATKQLPRPMSIYCELDHQDTISIKLESQYQYFHSRICILKWCKTFAILFRIYHITMIMTISNQLFDIKTQKPAIQGCEIKKCISTNKSCWLNHILRSTIYSVITNMGLRLFYYSSKLIFFQWENVSFNWEMFIRVINLPFVGNLSLMIDIPLHDQLIHHRPRLHWNLHVKVHVN